MSPPLPVMRARSLALLTALACGGPPSTGRPPASGAVADSGVGPPRSPAQSAASVGELIESRVPRAVAGEPGWRYQQRASADLDGDGAPETAVLIADAELDARGGPLWDDGHRWQVYVEEADGTRTRVYARFLPNGKLTADLARADPGAAPTIVLLEQTPFTLRVYDVGYRGPNQAAVLGRFERVFGAENRFTGSPRP